MKNNQRTPYHRNVRPYFNAAHDIQQVTTICEEIVRKKLADERENLSEVEEQDGGGSKLLSSGHISTKQIFRRNLKGNSSMNLESGKLSSFSWNCSSSKASEYRSSFGRGPFTTLLRILQRI